MAMSPTPSGPIVTPAQPVVASNGVTDQMAASSSKMEDENVELKDFIGGESQLPIERDVMQLARLGELGIIQTLFDQGEFDPKYKDEEGITPLHWAAINNRYALCRYLLEIGADVNAKGGESVATPAMWAAQRCHYYVVHLLLQHGADPLLTDVQGYNIMHLATFDGNLFLLVLLLHQDIPVDAPDPQGHTCLMWAAYKGFPACVDLFLRWGANVNAADETGFTALHWALVKGSHSCIQKLVEHGSDRFAETATGKMPAIVAKEMHSVRAWHRALADCGYDEDGSPRNYMGMRFLSSRGFLTKFFFLWPFLMVWCVVMILSHAIIYLAVPLAALTGYALQTVAIQMLQFAPPDMKHIHRTPFLAGIFAGTSFLVVVRWWTTLLPGTSSSTPFMNIFFALCYVFCTVFYYCSIVYDPGYVPKLAGLTERKTVIDELLGSWKFDAENYCVSCMVRKPLRSKHCKKCARCVAKHDHHCPWTYNCVGVNNHRHFLFYLLFLEIGVLIITRLTYTYIDSLPDPVGVECNIVSKSICLTLNKDPYTLVLVGLTAFQLVWVTMLIVVQLVQVARAQTTYENMRGNLHPPSHGAPEFITSALTAGTTSMEGAQLTSSGMGPDPAVPPPEAPPHHPHHTEGLFTQWKRLLGLDTFYATAQAGLTGKRVRHEGNPFSRGIITNCQDFWCDGAPIFKARGTGSAAIGGAPVDYTQLYETPPRLRRTRMGASQQEGGYERVAGDEAV